MDILVFTWGNNIYGEVTIFALSNMLILGLIKYLHLTYLDHTWHHFDFKLV